MKVEHWKATEPQEANPPGSLTCPKCGRTSHNRNDIEHLYCDGCVLFIRDAAPWLCSLMTPEELKRARKLSCVYVRMLEGGRFLAVEAWLSPGALLKICRTNDPFCRVWTEQDLWIYEQASAAVVAAANWNPDQGDPPTAEPFGWCRHPGSGRLRPFGNPAAEYRAKWARANA